LPTAKEIGCVLTACAASREIRVDGELQGAIQNLWNDKVINGKISYKELGTLLLETQDENLKVELVRHTLIA
jgi:hypothetical protein